MKVNLIVKNCFRLLGTPIVLLSILLTGCVSQSSLYSDPAASEVGRNSLPPEPQDNVLPDARTSSAVANLVSTSQQHYNNGAWDAAIAAAERALRIERRDPNIYLLLAKSYRAIGDTGQALQFLEQGLRYVNSANAVTARELDQLNTVLRN